MITPLLPSVFVYLASPSAGELQPRGAKVFPWRQWKTYITLFSIVMGLLLVASLTDLPLVIQVLLGGILGLVIYGMLAASFIHLRLWLLLGLAALTLFSMMNSFSGLELATNQQAMFWDKSASEEFHELLSKPEQYHVLIDELFISQACWKKHSSQLNPLQSQ